RRAFDAAVRAAPDEARLAHARSLAPKHPDEALALVADLAATRRADVADLLLTIGRAREAAKLLSGLVSEGAEAVHVEVLRALAEMRDVASKETSARRTPKGRRRSRRARHAAAPPAPELDARLGAEVERLLAQSLTEPDRRRLLAEAVRFELFARHQEHARRHLSDLLAASPTATAGSEEIFADAFALLREGSKEDLLSAARLLDEEASLYRDVSVRRRAVYWAARARARAGDLESARPLYASLLSGPSPDLYAVWAAGELGVVLSPSGSAGPAEGETVLSKESAGAPSRELLACGFPDLAEDQAEDEGSLDPLFGAALASERDDHRRAAHLLKLRWPELGTPDEGAVPLAARRAFYPLARYALVTRTAEENGLAPSLLFALIRQESLFQPLVTSRAGAVGLMQVMPATGRLLARRERRRAGDLKDPAENLRLGARYLASLVRLFGGDEAAALAAYNAGPGRMLRWRREGKSLRRDELLESIPMREPRDYVKRVLFFQGAYSALYGLPLAPGAPAPVHPRTL
ncbi:MAG TPA: lytic transglycosylase domain-containing protein, partial [Thermoanaerobaculia bacterium]|nr:lytic transglycosylase domain-containing protein [Thermoanaerobaculia bacterium]